MAISNNDLLKHLPKGTYEDYSRFGTFHYKEFTMSRRFFIYHSVHRPFDWKGHIDMTFRKCMKPMTDRMMRVV